MVATYYLYIQWKKSEQAKKTQATLKHTESILSTAELDARGKPYPDWQRSREESEQRTLLEGVADSAAVELVELETEIRPRGPVSVLPKGLGYLKEPWREGSGAK